MSDINYTDVSLLIHADGTDGSTSFTDASPLATTVTSVATTVSTARSKFGGASALLNGTSSYLSVPSSSAFDFGSGDFTIEAWVYLTNATEGATLVGKQSNWNSAQGFNIRVSAGATQYLMFTSSTTGTDATIRYATSVSLANNTWYHIAWTRNGGALAAFVDGVLVTPALSISGSIYFSAEPLLIGARKEVTPTGFLAGNIDDLRITKGVARYIASGAPYAAPSEAFFDPSSSPNSIYIVAPSPVVTIGTIPGTCTIHAIPTSPSCTSYCGAVASLSAPSPVSRVAAGTHLAITAPSPLVTSRAHDSTGENAAHITAPSPTLSFYTGAVVKSKAPSPKVSATGTTTNWAKAAITSPKPTVSATATVSGMMSAAIRAPSPNIVGYGGAVARIKLAGKVAVSANVIVGSVVRVAAVGPAPTVAAYTGASASLQAPKPTATSAVLRGSQINAAIRAPSPNIVGYGGAVCSVTLTGGPTVQSNVTTGAVASIAVTCPLFQVEASATEQNYGSLHVIAPSPRMGTTMQAWVVAPMARLTAIGSATITATYEAYAINLNHTPVRGVDPVDEVTRYTNFPFTHVVRYKNSYYGANSTGLYLLEGTTDDEAPIEFAVKTAMTDFDSPTKKNVSSAYFGGRFGPASTVQLHAGEQAPNTYSYSTPRDALAQNHRQVFGKGLKERYYAIGMTGTGALELDSIELDVKQLTRRI